MVRQIDPATALNALREAAAARGVRPAQLTTFDYRAARGRREDGGPMPSDFAISLLFGSWQRACELADRDDAGGSGDATRAGAAG